MNEQEEAAFVDSFFLPGGILDEEEEEKEETPSLNNNIWSGAPPENPWANESCDQILWTSETRAAPLQEHQPTVAAVLNANRVLPQTNGLGSPGPIGNASYDPVTFAQHGPLQGGPDALIRETLQQSLDGPPLLSDSHQQNAYPAVHQTSIPPPTAEPSYFASKNGGSLLPFRPPPGFSHPSVQQSHPTRSRIIQHEEAPLQPILNPDDNDNDDDDDSIRSVPHELYDRESLSASSLSGSSSVDESTSMTNTSSILDETPNTSAAHLEELEIRESRDELVEKKPPNILAKCDREDIAEKSSGKLPESNDAAKPSSQPTPNRRPPSSPVNKSRNKRGKAKRNRSNNTANKSKATSVCVEKKQASYVEYARAAVDWTSGSIQHFLSVMKAGSQTALQIFKSTTTFWISLLRLCRKILFALIRLAGILVSFSVLIAQNAFLEASQEWRVLSYFIAVYFTPYAMTFLMERVVLPHWTPHVLSCVVLCCLCRQPYTKILYVYPETDNTDLSSIQFPTYVPARSNDGDGDDQGSPARIISKVILRQVRFNLPVMFLLEGFAHEIANVMALDGPGRIISAYICLILRLSLLFSPMAWLCGAIQVLMATYLYRVPLIDFVVVLVALASVRHAKFLEQCNQAAKDIRAKEK